ncbi:MAG: hypothetical protein NVS3B20_08990 [Polyangiales bacterium]
MHRALRSPVCLALFIIAASCGSTNSKESPPLPPPKVTEELPALQCGPGTTARVGVVGCVPVGPTNCATGFVREVTGWGCVAQTPKDCSPNERAGIGDVACLPVDDCTAPFPPGKTTVLVSARAMGSSLVPQVATISEALALVGDHGTIAIDDGEYPEAVAVTKNVRLIGRCASSVTIKSSGKRGILVKGSLNVELRSITVSGGEGGVVAADGAKVDLSRMIITRSNLGLSASRGASLHAEKTLIHHLIPTPAGGAGITLADSATITLDDVEIRETNPAFVAFDDSSHLVVRRTLASYLGATTGSALMSIWSGAQVVVEDSVLRTRVGKMIGLEGRLGLPSDPKVSESPSQLRVMRSELTQSGGNLRGLFMKVAANGGAEFDETTVHHQSPAAIAVGEPGSVCRLRNSVIEVEPAPGSMRVGLMVLRGASAELDSVAIVGALNTAVMVGGRGSRLVFDRSLVVGTVYESTGTSAEVPGLGMAVAVGKEGQLTATDSALVANQQIGIGVADKASAQFTRVLVDDTTSVSLLGGGFGIVVENDGQFAMDRSIVRKSADAAFSFNGSRATVEHTAFVNNEVALSADKNVIIDLSAGEMKDGALGLRENVFIDNRARLRDGRPTVTFAIPSN